MNNLETSLTAINKSGKLMLKGSIPKFCASGFHPLLIIKIMKISNTSVPLKALPASCKV
jgi:hypothetical protein